MPVIAVKMEKSVLKTNLDLFVILKESGKLGNYLRLFGTVQSQLGLSLSEEDRDILQEFCRRFSQSVLKRWKIAKCNTVYFRKHYMDWLEQKIVWPTCVLENIRPQESFTELPVTNETEDVCAPSTSSSVGTSTKAAASPRKPFADLGVKQKKRRVDDFEYKDRESTELAYATIAKLKQEGNDNLATAIDLLLKNPKEAENIIQRVKQTKKCTFTPAKALGLLLSLKLSKWQYMTLRESTLREGITDLYPSYYKIQQAKLDCYPPKEAITVTDLKAKVSLQALLDITAARIIKSLSQDIKGKSMTLISKWGFDGASSQSTYKQNIEGEESGDDEAIFMTTLVPLKIQSGNEVIWDNPKPCSALYCRPLQFMFAKESKVLVQEQLAKIEDEIKSLKATQYESNTIDHSLVMTMIDGKICTYLSDAKSSATCYLCLAKPSEMNELQTVSRRHVQTDLYKFGLSPLHARINCMECLLHIAYRQDLKTWSVRGDNKNILEAKKKEIQSKFRAELGLLIDKVKQGPGTTNDGNTSRKFFEFPDKTAAITGLDEELIRRFAVILQVIACGEIIHVDKFREYTRRTAERYVELYNWYYMSATMHKILMHGADIANVAIVPIGKLSEEASRLETKISAGTESFMLGRQAGLILTKIF